MTEVKPTQKTDFGLTPVKNKPKRAYRKGSKFDAILEAFLKSKETLSSVSVPDKDGNYLRTQLKKRVDAVKAFNGITISVINNVCYLEKLPPTPKKETV